MGVNENTTARDLPYLANAKSKPISVVLAEAKAKLQAIEDSLGGERQPFQRITAAELATGKFDLTYLIDGVLVKDQPAGLVARSSFAHWWSPAGFVRVLSCPDRPRIEATTR